MLAKAPGDRPAITNIRGRLKEIASAIVASGSFQFEGFTTETPGPRARTAPAYAETASVNSSDSLLDALTERPRRSWLWLVLPALGMLAIGVVAVVMLRRGSDAPASVASRPPTPPQALVEPSPPVPSARPAAPEPTAAPSVGTVEVETSPATAKLTIDGRPLITERGRARVELATGTYLVASTAAGYRPSSQHVTVTASQVTALTIRLRPRSVAKPKRDSDAVVNPFDRRPRKP